MAIAKNKTKIPPQPPQPRWDAKTHFLWLDILLVKRFEVPSQIQEFILKLFQNCNWEPIISVSRLPGESDRSLQDRLHDVVTALNRDQKDANIYFFRTGQGNEIAWELIPTHKKGPRKRRISDPE